MAHEVEAFLDGFLLGFYWGFSGSGLKCIESTHGKSMLSGQSSSSSLGGVLKHIVDRQPGSETPKQLNLT